MRSDQERAEFETRRHDTIALLEAALANASPSLEDWRRLARIRLQQGRADEALEALEHAVWALDAGATAAAFLEVGGPWEGPGGELLTRALSSAPPSLRALSEVGGLRPRTGWIAGRLVSSRAPDAEAEEALRAWVLAAAVQAPAFVAAAGGDPVAWVRLDRESIDRQVRAERW